MPKKTINRREFLSRGAQAGAAVLLGHRLAGAGGSLPPAEGAADPSAVAVATGADYGALAVKAVDLLGGMGRFVAKGAKVALLPNVQSKNPGAFTKPEILRSVIRMCKAAGAAEVACLSSLGQPNWDGTGLAAVIQEEGAVLKLVGREDANYKAVPVPGAAALPEARLMNELFAYQAFINMPITKDHAGNKFTGTMKNLMGLNAPGLNRSAFHKPNWKTDPADIEHLENCIVDLNFAFAPTLNIVDATEIIRTNGPFGPGELAKPQKIVAGIDRVAIDAYCAKLQGLDPAEIVAIRKAGERKLGQSDLTKIKLLEARLG